MAMSSRAHVLVVAGSDSSGGAGITRDVETIASLGLRACLAVTAVTVQTHGAVTRVEAMPPALVKQQMRAALEANPVKTVKIGMVATAETVGAISAVLRQHPRIPAILDPVLASSSGRALLQPDAVARLKHDLIPLCALVTPNLAELAILTGGKQAVSEAEVIAQGERLLQAGCRALLVKGGHAQGVDATDILLQADAQPVFYSLPRLEVRMRGTGCILGSAIASLAARGEPMDRAVHLAKTFLHQQLSLAVQGARR